MTEPSRPTVPASGAPVPAGPDRFGKFVRVERLGSGGMGEVWKARDEALARWVALKLLKGGDDDEIARFTREAQTAAKLAHPNIAAIHEVGQDHGRHFIAMQYVEGRTLKAHPRDDRRELARIVRDAARAAAFAHEQGIVHRDIKPENLMVTPKGHVFVMDFGLARVVEGERSVSGSVVGTPAYMPPEQARGEKVDARADVYSLGATLYELLTDRAPFRGANVYELLRHAQEDEPRPPRSIDPKISDDLETIVLKCLEKERGRRYAGAGDLADDLDRWRNGEPVAARRASVGYRLRKRLAQRKGLVAVGALGLSAFAAALLILVPRLGEKERALEIWSKVSVVFGEAQALARAGQMAHARAKLDQGIALCRGFIARGESAHAHYFLARLLRERGDRAGAMAALDRAVELDARLGEARFERGSMLIEEHRLRAFAYSRVLAMLVPTESYRTIALAEVEASFPDMVVLRERAAADFDAPVGQSPYFRQADALCGRAELAWARGDSREAEAGLKRALEADPLHVRALLSLASLAVEAGRHPDALAHADAAIDRHRGCAEAYVRRADAFLSRAWQAGHAAPREWIEEARRAAERALELDPELIEGHVLRGTSYEALGDLDEAIRSIDAIVRRRPQEASWLVNRAAMLVRAERFDEARRDVQEALKRVPGLRQAHHVMGMAAVKTGDLAGAQAAFEEVVRADPRGPIGWSNLALVRRTSGDLHGALEAQTKCVESGPTNAVSWNARGAIRLRLGDVDGAMQDLDEALRLDPGLVHAHANRAAVLLRRKDVEGAERQIEAALKADPRHAAAWSVRGSILMTKGDAAGARAAFDRALAIEPKHIESRINRGMLFHATGEPAAASADLEEAVRLDPGNAVARTERGRLRVRLGESAGALEDFDRALELDPKMLIARAARIPLRMERKDWDGVIEDCTEVLRVDPANFSAHNYRGVARVRKGDARGAREDFDAAIASNPRQIDALLNRAKLREKDDPAGAREDCEEAVRVDPGNAEGYVSRGRLRGISGDKAGGVADMEKALELAPKDWPMRATVEELVRRLKR